MSLAKSAVSGGSQCRHSESFTLYEGSEVCAQLKDKLGGKEIAMSQLQDWLVVALNEQNLTITAAAKHQAFSLLDRQRLQTWQHKFTPGSNPPPTCYCPPNHEHTNRTSPTSTRNLTRPSRNGVNSINCVKTMPCCYLSNYSVSTNIIGINCAAGDASFEQFRTDIGLLTAAAKTFQQQVST